MADVMYHLNISADHLRTIGAALNEMPHRLARPVMDALQAQITEQDEAALRVPPPPVVEHVKAEDSPLPMAEVVPEPTYRIPTPEEFREAIRKVPRRYEPSDD